MKISNMLAALGWMALGVLNVSPAIAGEGHDHGEAPVATGGPALPRFTAVSETFELVGVVNGKQITLYLDRFADGSPVKDARLELELGGTKVPVAPHAEGEFEATLPEALKTGVVPVAVTVIAGDETDLLAGELDVHDEAAAAPAADADDRMRYAMWAGGAGIGMIVLIALGRRLRMSRNARLGGVA